MKNDKKQTPVITYHPNGQKEDEVNWKDGKHHGVETSWYESGKKKFGANFKDDEAHGMTCYWHENGQKKTGKILCP